MPGEKTGNRRRCLLSLKKAGFSLYVAKMGKWQAWLAVGEHGGQVEVVGKGEGKAGMGINEYANGVVATWDKNGYRQK